MARRGGALSDSESDVSEDDDISDVEDEALRRRVREAATGGRRDASGASRAGDHAHGAAPTRAPAASAGEASATTAVAGRDAREPADGRQTLTDARDLGVDDEEREVLCAAVSDASAPPRHVPGINSGQIGPELAKLRSAQGEHAEYYTLEHYDRLYGRRRAWARDARGSKVWCKDVHGPGCRECTSCHFCRQKTTDIKTRCQCGEWRKAPPGGRGRGVWCGWCLEMRMGENIDEALADEEWRCPVCRDICNCSGANCLRAKRNLFPTQQLTHEALQFGWQSVAHYLITTRIRENARGPVPMLHLPRAQREQFQRRRAQIGAGGGAGGGAAARARRAARAEDEARRRRSAALRDAVARRLGEALRAGERAADARDAAQSAGTDARGDDDGEGDVSRRRAPFRSFGGDADEASSGSDLNSDDEEEEEEEAVEGDEGFEPNAARGESGIPSTDRDRRGGGPGVGGSDVGVDSDNEDDAPRQAPAAPRAVRPRDDDDVVPDSQSDEDADVRGTRTGVGGGGGLRRAKRPRVRSDVGPDSAAAAAAAPSEGTTGTRTAQPRDFGDSVRLRRRRAPSRRAAHRADREADREAAAAEAELVSRASAAAAENEAARALREALAMRREGSDAARGEGTLDRARAYERLVDRAADALAAAEAAALARAARSAAARRAESSSLLAAVGGSASVSSASVADASRLSAVAEREADETLAAFCALAVFLARHALDVRDSTASAARRALERLVRGGEGDGANDAAAFRARSGVRRAATLRACLRSLEHARAGSVRALERELASLASSAGAREASERSSPVAEAAAFATAQTAVFASLLAVLGEEFCLSREHARWRARRGETDVGADAGAPRPPPPLPPALAAFVGEDEGSNAASAPEPSRDRAGADAAPPPPSTAGSSDGERATNAAERLLERAEECHVLLTHALRASRRLASAATVRVRLDDGRERSRSVDAAVVPPGAEALLSETFAAFLRPRYPFRARLRRLALAVVARAATAARGCVEGARVSFAADAEVTELVSRAATRVARALDETVWPALASLLARDHPARSSGGATGRDPSPVPVPSLPPPPDASFASPRDASSGCARAVIEACARTMACALAARTWSWGRCEREITAPHADAADFWRRAAAPYRALALRLYGRLCDCDASPVLSAGAGAPLLKLWVLATLDPAAAEGRERHAESAVGGFGRARARLARAARRHPVLRRAFRLRDAAAAVETAHGGIGHGPNDDDDDDAHRSAERLLVSPAAAPLETRAEWARAALARLCAADPSDGAAAPLAALAAANALWEAAPARLAEVSGSGAVADAFADAVAGVSAAVVRRFAAKLHATRPGSEGTSFHAAGAGICVASASAGPRSVTASRLTAMTHVIAARHARATAVASSARSVASGALAAAAFAGSSRAEAAAATSRRAERAAAASLRRAGDAVVGLRALFRGAPLSAANPDAGSRAVAQPQDDPPLVGAVVALTHALWERGPPRAPTEEARDAAADAFFENAFVRSGGGVDGGVDGGVALASFAVSAVFRRALARCVPTRALSDESPRDGVAGFSMNGATHGGHAYPPGAVAAALGTIRVQRRLLMTAERDGTLPETVAGTFCVVASALLDAAFPPPPPPDPRRAAPPSGAQAAPPAVRRAAYEYFADLAARAPGACAARAEKARDEDLFGERAYLREFWVATPPRVVDAAVRAALEAAVTFAACEVAAASGFAGAREAARGFAETASETRRADAAGEDDGEVLHPEPVDARARAARAAARRALRGLLGSHPGSGAHEEVLRRFKPPPPRFDGGGGGGTDAAAFANRNPRGGGPTSDGAVARDAPAGKDFDAADAALAFLRDYASTTSDASALVARRAFPALAGALSERGAGNVRRYTRRNARALWDVVTERLGDRLGDGGAPFSFPALPPAPPEASAGGSGRGSRRVADPVTVARSGAGALNHRTRAPIGVAPVGSGGDAERSPWPASAPPCASFAAVAALCAAAQSGDATARRAKTSVIGAVVARDPAVGVKPLRNPKTGKSYDMLFLTLADHTGARCKAQLLGARAAEAAAKLDACFGDGGVGSGARVVVGLCGVLPRAGGAAAVWDPKEESAFALRPEHPAANRL